MNCRRVEHLLQDQLEGLITEHETRPIAAHLDRCLACRRLQEHLLAPRGELRALAHRLPLRQSRVDLRAIDCWLAERDPARGTGQRWFPAFSAPAPAMRRGAVGAAALLLALLGLLLARGGHSRPAGSPTPIARGASPDSLLQPLLKGAEKSLPRKREGGSARLTAAPPVPLPRLQGRGD